MSKPNEVPNLLALEILKEAEQLLGAGDLDKSSKLFSKLLKDEDCAPIAYYRLATIANCIGKPIDAKKMYYEAFQLRPDLPLIIYGDHPNRDYVFPGKQYEPEQTCFLCGKKGEPYWCYILIEVASDFGDRDASNPVRTWVHCKDCNHLYAEEFPEFEFEQSNDTSALVGRATNPNLFSIYSEILGRLEKHAKGKDLLEIGVGGSDCILVAREMGFNTFGIDIDAGNVNQAKRYNLSAEVADFVKFETDKKWDVIVFGDVIEHVSDPLISMQKISSLLNDGGCVWISTPNFESAFSAVAGHNDPMRRIDSHKNYFSRDSLNLLLQKTGFKAVDYRVSRHYNGSMEMIAVKEA